MSVPENYVRTADGVRLYFEKSGDGPPVVIPNGIIYLDDFRQLAGNRTLIAYDPRNRGRSDQTGDGDIQRDVEDLETLRRYFDIGHLDLVGHSYVGLLVALYAAKYPAHVNRIVQIGPMEPVVGRRYPPHLSNNDGVTAQVFGRLGQLYRQRRGEDDIEMCRKAWEILGALYVTDPADASKINWGRCELPNERNFVQYWTTKLLPSIQAVNMPELVSKLTMPILTIHGTKDRNAPYGAGREWASMLPNARLLNIEDAAHAPWIEAPATVLSAMETFFDGSWPENAEKVEIIDSASV